MTKQKSKQFAVNTTSDKTIQPQPLVQLTVEQLEDIAAGIRSGCPITHCGVNHNETMVSVAQQVVPAIKKDINC